AGVSARGSYAFAPGLALRLDLSAGYVAGIDVPVGDTTIQLSALALDGAADLSWRLPLGGGALALLLRGGYLFSQFAPQQPANTVLFTAHTWHGGRLSLGVEAPLPGVPIRLHLEGGPSLLFATQWPETLGQGAPVLGWHGEVGLRAPLWAGWSLDLRYRLYGRDARFSGGGTRSPDVTEARTEDLAHGLSAGVARHF
ncbi:MAG: hypothetical protein D6729_11890, partial [Deltaproteobacteria bacterium]